MKLLCESFVKEVLPAVRSLVAKDLLEKHGLTQKEAARRLEMTQPAISQYKNRLRGRKVKRLEDSKTISNKIKVLAEQVAREEVEKKEYDERLCEICREAREESLLAGGSSC